MSAMNSEAAVLSSLLLDPPPVLVAPTLLRALGLAPARPAEVDFTDGLDLLTASPAECAA
ncbi:hypothetical protein [Streptomyces sp. A1136]|uniref:hypothetical protein n=1 Tax=Streptomyces sp. A1136 TaxID=2563102 RepID=UPI00109EAE02|nr:hypothetical protein [Streptomyces sp. A1136]THA56143.1 hypothetical protein E6R62_12425 [Streptomyces sp. A1136]